MNIKSCRLCGSHAINEHLHGRTLGVKSDLCDVCYWQEIALESRVAERLPKRELSVEESLILGLAKYAHESIGYMTTWARWTHGQDQNLSNLLERANEYLKSRENIK